MISMFSCHLLIKAVFNKLAIKNVHFGALYAVVHLTSSVSPSEVCHFVQATASLNKV